MNTLRKLALLCIAFSLSACTAAEEKPSPIMPITQPLSYNEPVQTYSNPGSLFQASTMVDLYQDSRARKVGDVVIINIVENNNASNSADTSSDKSTSRDLSVGALFGQNAIPLLGAVGDSMVNYSASNDFSGSGSTSRSNTITATVAARVVKVMSDGLLHVEGIRETRVNNEKQYIVVRGLVRSRDINPDNTLLSTHLADAQIEYYGSGIVNDSQKPSWLARLVDSISPL